MDAISQVTSTGSPSLTGPDVFEPQWYLRGSQQKREEYDMAVLGLLVVILLSFCSFCCCCSIGSLLARGILSIMCCPLRLCKRCMCRLC